MVLLTIGKRLSRATLRSLTAATRFLVGQSSSKLARQASANLVANFFLLATTVGTGILLARALGTVGRGNLAAILAAPPLLATVFGMGCTQAIVYEQARDPEAYSWLISTWTVMLLPFIVVGVVLGELLVGVLLRTQALQVQRLAAFSIPALVFLVLGDIAMGILVGDHDFRFYNRIRLAQGLGILSAYVVLRLVGHLNVVTAVSVVYGVYGVAALTAMGTVLSRYGFGRFDWNKGRASFWYGFRAHGTNVSQLASLRLDQLILPAFVTPTSLGVYAVAVSVSSLVINLATPLASLVLPVATRREGDRAEVIRRATQGTFIIAAVVGIAIAAFAVPAVNIVYGPSFSPSVPLIRWLLAGSVLYVAGYTLWQGLYAVGKPFSATVAQATGLTVTVIGLFVFLPRGGGTTSAAILSSTAYAAVMTGSLLLFCRTTGVPVRSFLVIRTLARQRSERRRHSSPEPDG